jgi:hypothetical protein
VRALGPLNWNRTGASIPVEIPAEEVKA